VAARNYDAPVEPTLEFEWEEEILVACFAGEIDLAYTDAFLQAIIETAEGRPAGVVLDLSEVVYLDSAGVRLLFLAHRELDRACVPLVTVLPRLYVVRRILSIAELPAVVPVSETRTEACAQIKLDKAMTTAAQLQHALESRVVIEQAKGILAERHNVELPEAFERMRALSRRSRRSVRAIATDVVTGAIDLPA